MAPTQVLKTVLWFSLAALVLPACGALAGADADTVGGSDALLSLTGTKVKMKMDVVVSLLPTKVCGVDADCASMDDGDKCNGLWSCQSGKCHPKADSAVSCDDAYDLPCERNTCEPSTGVCARLAIGDGGVCSAPGCAAPGTCSGGACKPGAPRTCETGYGCDGNTGACVLPTGTCADAVLVDAFPYSILASTDDLAVPTPQEGNCSPTSEQRGPGYRHLYRVKAQAHVNYMISLNNSADVGVLLLGVTSVGTSETCSDQTGCQSKQSKDNARTFRPMADGSFYIAVLRTDVQNHPHPGYHLTITPSCVGGAGCPDAAEHPCGYNVCGAACGGTCDAGEVCKDNRCRDAGDICETAIPLVHVSTLWSAAGNSHPLIDYALHTSDAGCQTAVIYGVQTVVPTGAPPLAKSESVFSFIPATTGDYTIMAQKTGQLWLGDRCNGANCLDTGVNANLGTVQHPEFASKLLTTLVAGHEYRIYAAPLLHQAGTPFVTACKRTCTGVPACSDDGCGGICETCPDGSPCQEGANHAFTCCIPQCDGKNCGNNGCGGTCGDCGAESYCKPNQTCCVPNCAAKTCGNNGCGGSCGSCPEDSKCLFPGGACCVPNCAGKECGFNGCQPANCNSLTQPCAENYLCGIGICPNNRPCEANSTCCVPNCSAKVCGSDGCGGSCGATACTSCAPDGKSCCDGQCDGKQCGTDACGKSCGACPSDKACDGTTKMCVPPPGDACANALLVGPLPYSGSGNTTFAAGDYSAVLCQFGGLWGKGSRDQVWAFTPTTTGNYSISLNADFDAALYVVDSCTALPPKCQVGTIQPASAIADPLVVNLKAGVTWHIIVDGIDNAPPGAAGAYTLKIDAAKPAGPVCGNGTCDSGETSSTCLADCPMAADAGATDVGAADAGSAPDTVDDIGANGPASLEFAAWALPPDAPTAANYTVGADTVADNTTGLVWQRNLPATANRAAAIAYCDSLVLATASDWRLPTRIELLSIVNTAKAMPVIDTAIFPGVPGGSFYSPVPFWTTSTDVQDPGYGWPVDFAYGAIQATSFATVAQVRCVRAGKSPPLQHYTVQTDTVKDNATGLVWQRVPSEVPGSLSDAIAVCNGLKLVPYSSGWRLAGKKELETLVDVTIAQPAVPGIFQLGGFTGFWANAVPANSTELGYQLFMGYGGTILMQFAPISNPAPQGAAWCVHGP